MIIDLANKLKHSRENKGFTLQEVSNISFDFFDEVINADYLQKLENNKFNDIEIWTLYKLASIYETNILFAKDGITEVHINNHSYQIKYSLLMPFLDIDFPKNHNDKDSKKQFLSLLGEYISSSRKSLKLTQNKLAELTSVSRATLQRIELSTTQPKTTNLLKILLTIFQLKNEG